MGCKLEKKAQKNQDRHTRLRKPDGAAKLSNRLDMTHKNVHDKASGAISAAFSHTGATSMLSEPPHFRAFLRRLRDTTATTQT
jgi:hypothetical protein